MVPFHCKRLLAGFGMLACGALSSSAAQADAGLSGSYFVLSSSPGIVANAESLIVGAVPAATFTSTSVNYQNLGDNSGLSTWLGSDAASLNGGATIGDLQNHVLTLVGQIFASAAGSYNFVLGSDDGSALWINGVKVLNNDGDHGYQTVNADITLSQGWNNIRVLQFEDQGSTALTLQRDRVTVDSSITRTAAVPGPIAGAGLPALLGLMGFSVWRRRRQKAA